MNNDNEFLFRIAVGVVFAIWLLARAYFDRRFGDGEKVLQRHTFRENISYVLVALSAVPAFIYVVTGLFSFAHFFVTDVVRWTGLIVGLWGCMLFIQTHMALGKNWSGVLEIAKEHELVVQGPYRFVRHPMYTAFFAMSIGILLLSANWFVGGIIMLSVTYMYTVRVSDEEAMMLEQFGADYQRYMKSTGRLLPHFRDLRLKTNTEKG